MIASWRELPVDLPPSPEQLRREAKDLLIKHHLLKTPAEKHQQAKIIQEASIDLSGYLRPLGVEVVDGYSATESLFYLVLALTDEIRLRYKYRYNVARPNQTEPRLRPLLPNPPH